MSNRKTIRTCECNLRGKEMETLRADSTRLLGAREAKKTWT